MTMTDTVTAYGTVPLRKSPTRGIDIINFEFMMARMPVSDPEHTMQIEVSIQLLRKYTKYLCKYKTFAVNSVLKIFRDRAAKPYNIFD